LTSTLRYRGDTSKPAEVAKLAFYGGIAGTALFAALCIAAPLAVYTVSLAAFGLPHVLSELRYVDRRFGLHVGRALLWRMFPLLLAIVAARAALVFYLVPAIIEVPTELALVALLALSLIDGTPGQRIAAVLIAFAIGGATALAPFNTAVVLAVLHNLTPLGFLWQITKGESRTRVMSLAALGFVGLPLLVATGLPRLVLTSLSGTTEFDPLGAGPLHDHVYVYVPAALAVTSHAIDLFTASVVAQGAHYFCVIVVLPMMLGRVDRGAHGLFSWPSGAWFAVLCAGAATVGGLGFLNSFAESRALYGIFASVHAWLEIPVLIFALFGAARGLNKSRSRRDVRSQVPMAGSRAT
jgi:hypothetical protein